MTDNHPPKRQWTGSAKILPGIGVFKGNAGDNKPHRHWAHQFSIGLEGPIHVSTGKKNHQAHGIFIPAGITHQLTVDTVLSIYLDPTSNLSKTLCVDSFHNEDIQELPNEMVTRLVEHFSDLDKIEEKMNQYRTEMGAAAIDDGEPRLAKVLNALGDSVAKQKKLDRADLAKLVNLSNSRFSHWFRQQTGMPLRSYKKWLHLLRGTEIALSGEKLTDAAYQADFSDQAHFSRAFVQAFGISPFVALSEVSTKP